jgi:hypothetical protein
MKRTEITPNHITLTALISQLDGVEAAILIERIISSAKEIIDNQQTVHKALEGGFISADLYINTMQKVHDNLAK